MPLYIYNTLTRRKEAFKPIVEGEVRMYVCGVTVYDLCHIGHARAAIVFDIIYRYLKYLGYKVTYVRNFTDVDDKIIKRANEEKVSSEEIAERYIKEFYTDMNALSIEIPDCEPKATVHIPEMIEMIKKLIEKGYAYQANGDVFYSVRKFTEYGSLSGKNTDELLSGARVEIDEKKKDPLDFALWKASKPGEPWWDSPWGKGRPGWHIECSAMGQKYLGEYFDIHGGGRDLVFPHHENEIAQSEAAHQKTFANYWVHAGLLQVDHEKMSKSLGNFFTIREVLAKYPAEEIRYFMLSGHYRSPINYSEENLANVHRSLVTLYSALRDLPQVPAKGAKNFIERFQAVMDDDFNFPEAFVVLFEMAHEINRLRMKNEMTAAAELAAGLKQLAEIFGLLQQDPNEFLKGDALGAEALAVDGLINQRLQARRDKNWQEADRIRDQLATMDIVIEDHATGTSWRKK